MLIATQDHSNIINNLHKDGLSSQIYYYTRQDIDVDYHNQSHIILYVYYPF